MRPPAVSKNPHEAGTRKALAWDKGWRGMKAGLPLGSNPYGHRSGERYMRDAWEDGWLLARESERAK